MKPKMTNRISNGTIILIYLGLLLLLAGIGYWVLTEFTLPKGLLGLWALVSSIFSMDIACRIGYENYQSIFAFIGTLEKKDKTVFWGSLLTASLPFVVYLQFSEPRNNTLFSWVAIIASFLLLYFPIRLFGSTKLKKRIIERKHEQSNH